MFTLLLIGALSIASPVTAPCDTPVAGISTMLEYVDDYSEEDLQILEQITEAEATGQDIESRANMASVVINRLHSEEFPDSIKDVVFERFQFSPIGDGRYWKVKVTEDTKKAVRQVLMFGPTSTALYFVRLEHATNPYWFTKNLHFLFKDSSGTSYFK